MSFRPNFIYLFNIIYKLQDETSNYTKRNEGFRIIINLLHPFLRKFSFYSETDHCSNAARQHSGRTYQRGYGAEVIYRNHHLQLLKSVRMKQIVARLAELSERLSNLRLLRAVFWFRSLYVFTCFSI